jgi:glycosyltransferase involved in cell wall biosynthesis
MSESICVITPCFNASPFLASCLRSVAEQGESVHRHIVMDGGSTDGSVDILREFSRSNPRLEWRSEKDDGQSSALNKALALVDTRYFAWLNADDCYLPGKLRALIQGAQAQPAPTIVYGDYTVIDADGNVLRRRQQPSFNYWDCLYSYLTVQNCAAIFRTDVCRDTGGFDRELEFCMDYDLILRLGSGPVRHVREYVGSFRHHAGAKTSRLQDVCEVETERLRLKVSGLSAKGLRWRYWFGTMRVASRMLAEGCFRSRLYSTRVASDVRS